MHFRIFAPLGLALAAGLTGCGMSSTALPPVQAAPLLRGVVSTGPTPVAGAHVYLFAASTAGYGQPSVSLLDAAVTANADPVGAYVLTDAKGSFAIPSGAKCTSQTQLYLYAQGGDSGQGANSASGLLAAIGACPVNLPPAPVVVNEVTTVAAAFAFAGFATDAVHVSSSSTALAQTGVAIAFLNAANLADPSTGVALLNTPAGNGVAPRQAVNSLADILSSCVVSSGPRSAACTTLLRNSLLLGVNGDAPADTASAAINIAHFPGLNVAALYSLMPTSAPFSPALIAAPNDFTLGINFSGGGLSGPYAVAIDAAGSAWFANLGNSSISRLASTGAALSPANGITNGTPLGPVGIAFDPSGDAWIINAVSATLTKYASSGALLSPAQGYGGGGLRVPQAVASDGDGNIWVANYSGTASKFTNGGTPVSPASGIIGGGLAGVVSVAVDSAGSAWFANTKGNPMSITKLSSAGAPLSPVNGFTGGGIRNPFAIAIDNAGYAWVANYSGNSVTKLSPTGDPVSSSIGFTGGGLSHPFSIAIDGAGNAWVANSGAFSVTELSGSGAPLSPSTGYRGGTLNSPQAIAIDGAGNAWIANSNDLTVTEMIGVSVPVVTPLVTGIRGNSLGTRP